MGKKEKKNQRDAARFPFGAGQAAAAQAGRGGARSLSGFPRYRGRTRRVAAEPSNAGTRCPRRDDVRARRARAAGGGRRARSPVGLPPRRAAPSCPGCRRSARPRLSRQGWPQAVVRAPAHRVSTLPLWRMRPGDSMCLCHKFSWCSYGRMPPVLSSISYLNLTLFRCIIVNL